MSGEKVDAATLHLLTSQNPLTTRRIQKSNELVLSCLSVESRKTRRTAYFKHQLASPSPTFPDPSAPFPYIPIRKQNPSQSPPLKNNKKHTEQNQPRGYCFRTRNRPKNRDPGNRGEGVSNLTVEINHKLIVEEGTV